MIKDLFEFLVIVNANGDVGEYLDYNNCKCWKKIVDKLVEKCTELLNC